MEIIGIALVFMVVFGVIGSIMSAAGNAARKALIGPNATELNNQGVSNLKNGDYDIAEQELMVSQKRPTLLAA